MPVVSAADQPYSGVPTVTPETAVPYNNFRINATPEMFGAAIGRATSSLGQSLARGANQLEQAALERQQLYNQVAADDMTNAYQEKENKILRGDPSIPGDTGFFGKQGRAAMDAFGPTQQQLLDLRNNAGADAPNARVKLMFDQETRRLQAVTLSSMSAHYDQEFKRYTEATALATDKNATNDLSSAIARGDDAATQQAIQRKIQAGFHVLDVNGTRSPETEQTVINAARSAVVKETAEAINIKQGAFAATQYLDAHKDWVGPDYFPLREKYQNASRQTRAFLNGLPGGAGANTGGNVSDTDFEALWTRVKSAEGGIGAQGQALTSPAGAIGISQILPSTARDTAARLGLPFDQQRLYTDQKYNETLGRAYLQEQLDKYGGNPTLAAAAYNAGPDRVDQWLKTIGDPRTGQITDSQFQAAIPITETRNYVAKVVGDRVYQLGATPPVTTGNNHPINTGRSAAPTGAGDFVAIGDSIAAHVIRKAGVGGQESGVVGKHNEGDTAVAGWGPTNIGNMIDHMDKKVYAGKDIVLSTGAANTGSDTDPNQRDLSNNDVSAIKHEIETLLNGGARSVRILGVGTAARYGNQNQKLDEIARYFSGLPVSWAGPLPNVASDGIHSSNPQSVMQNVMSLPAPTRTPPEQLTPTAPSNPAPQQAQTSSGVPVQTVATTGDQVIGQKLPKFDTPLPDYEPGELPDDQVPGMAGVYENIMKNVPATNIQDRLDAIKEWRKRLNNAYQQQQQARTLRRQADQTTARNWENEMVTRLAPNSENKPTIQDIMTDPRLDNNEFGAEAKRTIVAMAEHKVDPAAAFDAHTKMTLYGRIHLPYGDPNKITTEQPINDAYAGEQLTYNSTVELRKELALSRTTDGIKLDPHKNSLFSTVRGGIWGIMGISEKARALDAQRAALDPTYESADQRLDRYKAFVNSQIQDAEDHNRDPTKLLVQGNPEYLGRPEVLKDFLPKMGQTLTPPPAATLPGQKDIQQMTEEELRELGNRSSVDRARAAAEARRRGIIPPTSPQIEAPMR